MRKFDVNKFILGVAKRFDITPCYGDAEPDCDKRKGIVYCRDRGGNLRPIAYEDTALKQPMVCDCSHEGIRMVIDYINKLIPLMAIADITGSIEVRIPVAEDFSFVYQDEAEEKLLELETTAEADSVINFVKGL